LDKKPGVGEGKRVTQIRTIKRDKRATQKDCGGDQRREESIETGFLIVLRRDRIGG